MTEEILTENFELLDIEEKVEYVIVSNNLGLVETEINNEFNPEKLTPRQLCKRLVREAWEHKEIALDTENGGLVAFQTDPVLIQISSPVNNYVFRAIDFEDFLDDIVPILTSNKITVIGHNLGYDIKYLRWHFGFELINVWDVMITEGSLTLGKQDPSTQAPLELSLKEVAYRYLDISLNKDLRKEFIGMDRNSPVRRELYDYSADDAAILFELKRMQQEKAKSLGLEKVIWLENRVVPVTADMEYNGVLIDLPKWRFLTVQTLLESLELLKKLHDYYSYSIIYPEPYVIRLKKNGEPCARQAKPKPFYYPEDEGKQLQVLLKTWKDGNIDDADMIEQLVYHVSGYAKTLNLNSPKNVLRILKEEGLEKVLGYELVSTAAPEMEKIEKALDTIEEFDSQKLKDFMAFRKKSKLLSSFLLAVPQLINPVTGRLHASFHQMPKELGKGGTTTGRYACSNPNLQQMPASDELRSCFIARKKKKIITADYTSMEVKITANFTKDPILVAFFEEKNIEDMPKGPDGNPVDPGDFHGYCASIVFGLPIEKVAKRLQWNEAKQEWDELDPILKKYRKMAKVATFAIFYGAKAHGSFTDKDTGKLVEYGLYLKLGISKEETVEVIRKYNEAYKVAMEAFTQAGIEAVKTRVLEGCCGRLKWVPIYEGKNSIIRKARNLKIQETNASQTKYALYLLKKELSGDKFQILSTVHDEIIAEVDEDVAEEYAAKMAEIMVRAATVLVPGPVKYAASYKVADHWKK